MGHDVIRRCTSVSATVSLCVRKKKKKNTKKNPILSLTSLDCLDSPNKVFEWPLRNFLLNWEPLTTFSVSRFLSFTFLLTSTSSSLSVNESIFADVSCRLMQIYDNDVSKFTLTASLGRRTEFSPTQRRLKPTKSAVTCSKLKVLTLTLSLARVCMRACMRV